MVSPETFGLVERAVAAWRVTGGRFDPERRRDRVADGRAIGTHDRARVAAASRSTLVCVRCASPPGSTSTSVRSASGFATDLAVADLVHGGATGALREHRQRRSGRRGAAARRRVVRRHRRSAPAGITRPPAAARGATGRVPRPDRSGAASGSNGIAATTVVAGEAWWAQVDRQGRRDGGSRRRASACWRSTSVTGVVVLDGRRRARSARARHVLLIPQTPLLRRRRCRDLDDAHAHERAIAEEMKGFEGVRRTCRSSTPSRRSGCTARSGSPRLPAVRASSGSTRASPVTSPPVTPSTSTTSGSTRSG